LPGPELKKTTVKEDLEEREQLVVFEVKYCIKFEERIEVKDGG